MDKIIKFAFIAIIILLIPLFWYLLSPLFIDDVVSEELPQTNTKSNQENSIEEEIDFEAMSMSTFKDADAFHKVSGEAIFLEGEGQKFLRLENFESTNGPDLFVYLATDTDATDFVDLGRLKGNKGNQNYEIPEGTNPEDYSHVLIWCKQFGVLFGSADIN